MVKCERRTADGTFEINIAGDSISKINIRFDSKLGAYATVLYMNGIMFMNDGFVFSYAFSRPQTNINIRIVALSEPMKPICITYINFGELFKTDTHTGLLSLDIRRQNRNNIGKVEYGVISQTADFKFVDRNGEIAKLISNGNNMKGVPARLYIDGTMAGVFESQAEWKYNSYSRQVSVSLQDNLVKWQDIKIKMKYDGQPKTLLQVVEFLIENSTNFNFQIEPLTRDFISEINIEYPFLKEETLWNQWNKAANIGQFVVYLLTNGTVYVKRIL